MSEVRELFTAMNGDWSDEQCVMLAADDTKQNAPWRDAIADIEAVDMNCKVVKITIEVLDQPLGDLLTDRQHRN